jgi:hypothetical protein
MKQQYEYPSELNIAGIPYKIKYLDSPSGVDIHGRDSLWGQVDYWTRTIRIYNNGRPVEDVWSTIIHEVLHAISSKLHLKLNDDDRHDELDVIALSITDVLFRNNLIKLKRREE